MNVRLGIGIITCNRKNLVLQAVQRVRSLTLHDPVALVVADDGSTDGTVEALRAIDVPVVSGINMGIAWNKNRALYLLGQEQRCDVVIILEDDTQPNAPGWEQDWIAAASRWGHICIALGSVPARSSSGRGTADDPFMSELVTAQCAAFSRAALDYGGYFDARFRGYGHEHVEHTRRLIRAGYGGTANWVDGHEHVRYAAISGALTVHESHSHFDKDQVARNLTIAHQAMTDERYRVPWNTVQEMEQFRGEMQSAISAARHGFDLRVIGMTVQIL